jgi:hypothetical protein
MTSLLALDVRGAKVTDAGLADMKSALPDVRITK